MKKKLFLAIICVIIFLAATLCFTTVGYAATPGDTLWVGNEEFNYTELNDLQGTSKFFALGADNVWYASEVSGLLNYQSGTIFYNSSDDFLASDSCRAVLRGKNGGGTHYELILKNATISGNRADGCIYFTPKSSPIDAYTLDIVLLPGTVNNINVTGYVYDASYGIRSDVEFGSNIHSNTITISGAGTLNINGNRNTFFALHSYNMNITGGATVYANGRSNSISQTASVYTANALNVTLGSSLYAGINSTAYSGVSASSIVCSGNSSITAKGTQYGLSNQNLTLNNGTLTLLGGTSAISTNTNTSFTPENPVVWVNTSASATDAFEWDRITPFPNYKYVQILPNAYVPPLIFTNSASYDIPAGSVGTSLNNIDVSSAVSGGTAPYTFSKDSGPGWLSVSNDGVLSGTPTAPSVTTTAVIRVTDATLPQNSKTITINVGAVADAPEPPGPEQYQISEGQYGVWTRGGSYGLRFTANGDYNKFTGVSVDGTVISSDKYTSESGSTIVTLNAQYLNALDAGEHALRVNFTDGYAGTYFTVNGYTEIPKTGDRLDAFALVGILLMAGEGLTVSIVIRRKRQNG